MIAALDSVGGDASHSRQYHLLEVEPARAMKRVQILLKVSVAEFVAFLIAAVLRTVLLHCIVGQVHQVVTAVLDGVFEACGPDVALRIPVAFELAVDARHEHVVPDIELPPVIKERPLQILLHDEGP